VYLLIGTINNKVYVRKDISLINVPTSRHNQWLDSWCRDYNIVSATGESGPGSGDTRSMLYENYKLHYTLPNKHRTVGWLKLADLIDQGNLIIHPECTDTLNSLESLSWISGTRGVDVEGPSDHWADATRYYCTSPLFIKGPNRSIVPPGPKRHEKMSISISPNKLPSSPPISLPNGFTNVWQKQ